MSDEVFRKQSVFIGQAASTNQRFTPALEVSNKSKPQLKSEILVDLEKMIRQTRPISSQVLLSIQNYNERRLW